MNPTDPHSKNIPKLTIPMIPKYIIVEDTSTSCKLNNQ